MRSRYDEQLKLLHKEMIAMGARCEEAIALATKAIQALDLDMARQVEPLAESIEQKSREIEGRCLKLILQQQPVARDLREISAALKMSTDMERIGDQAEDIAEIVTYLHQSHEEVTEILSDMARSAIGMVTDSVDAFVRQDEQMALDVMKRDEQVDNFFDKVRSSLIKLIAENRDEGAYALDLLMIGKYLERIADHAVNIASWVVFSVTGVHRGEL